ncbi:MAG TPA: hypothetical protein VGH39_08715, partial [Xanthobacteraceae bacterium]
VVKTVVDSVVFTSDLFFLCPAVAHTRATVPRACRGDEAGAMLCDGTNPIGQELEMRSGPDAPDAVLD